MPPQFTLPGVKCAPCSLFNATLRREFLWVPNHKGVPDKEAAEEYTKGFAAVTIVPSFTTDPPLLNGGCKSTTIVLLAHLHSKRASIGPGHWSDVSAMHEGTANSGALVAEMPKA